MKNPFVLVVTGALLLILIGFGVSWLTIDDSQKPTDLPWQIESMSDGSIRVFNTHLGVTTLVDFMRRYEEAPEVSLFIKENTRIVEAYFDQVVMAGLKAKVVLSFDFTSQALDEMYNRGARISTLPDGTRKVELSSEDLAALNNMPVVSITYIPSINVDANLIEKRFGTPAEKITDVNTGAVHWLYPDKGLDIALNDAGKELFQYVQPRDFEKLIQPFNTAK